MTSPPKRRNVPWNRDHETQGCKISCGVRTAPHPMRCPSTTSRTANSTLANNAAHPRHSGGTRGAAFGPEACASICSRYRCTMPVGMFLRSPKIAPAEGIAGIHTPTWPNTQPNVGACSVECSGLDGVDAPDIMLAPKEQQLSERFIGVQQPVVAVLPHAAQSFCGGGS